MRRFDGIICFGGEDWWYHNRGHYDMRMMRQFSTGMPVLYVNSIGMRTPGPGEGRMFFSRIRRKLQSIHRGLVRVGERFTVCSPIVFPSKVGIVLTKPLLTHAVRSGARKQRITQPLIWVACPTAAEAVEALDPAAIVYQRTDRYECFGGVDGDRIRVYDGWLKARADLTVFCSTLLFELEAEDCQSACFVDHGVDFTRFASAATGRSAQPQDIAGLPHPRVGFIGGIDAHTFDADLFIDVARQLPESHFVLVGTCSLPAGWCDLPNVSLLGQRPYEEIPGYMAACDVLIMPWNRSRWIEACNPVKLKEYLATGRPVVSTGFPELRQYDSLVRTATDADAFAEAIRSALREPPDAQPGRDRVRKESWWSKAQAVLSELAAQGIVPKCRLPGPALESANAPALTPKICAAPGRSPATPSTEATMLTGQRGSGQAARTAPHRRAWNRSGAEQTNLKLKQESHCRVRPADETPPARINLAAYILLAGGLRPSPLVAATGQSVLDLWLTSQRTVLDCWVERIAEFAPAMPKSFPVQVVHDSMLPPPWPLARFGKHVLIEQEPKPFRGPAGIVRDLCTSFAANQCVVVAEAARYLSVSLVPMLLEHADRRADITVASNRDGSPAGIYVIRCGTLTLVPAAGFMDLKEQWLRRAVDAALNVHVHYLAGPGALALRTRQQFLAAACVANQADPAAPGCLDLGGQMLAVRRSTGLRVICAGAVVGPDAAIVDSIVMPGATVGPNSVIARSLLCPHSRIQAGTNIVDEVVCADSRVSARRLAWAS